MAQDVTEVPPAEMAPERDGGAGRSVVAEIPFAIYRFLYNKNAGMVIILVLAFLVLLGTLIPQMPKGVQQDPLARADWLASAQERFGGWTGILDGLQIFTLYSSVIFVTMTVLLTLSIAACTLHRLPQIWKRATQPHVKVSEGFFTHAQVYGTASVAGDAAVAYQAAAGVFSGRRFRILKDDVTAEPSFYADKFRWGPFGTAAAHLAFIIIILGMLVSATFGSERYIPVTVGTVHEVIPGSGMTVEAVSFSDTYTVDGAPADYVSDLILRQGDTVLTRQEIRVNSPLTWDGMRIHQTSYGPAVVLNVIDANGAVLFDSGVPMDWTSSDGFYAVGGFPLAAQGLDVRVFTPASGETGGILAPGEMMLFITPAGSDSPVAEERMTPGTSVDFEGLTFTFERETKYTGLTVATDPGAIWVWIGSTLLVLGTVMTFGFRHRRLWVRVVEQDSGSLVRVAAVDRLDPIQERQFVGLLEEIGELREFTVKRTEADDA